MTKILISIVFSLYLCVSLLLVISILGIVVFIIPDDDRDGYTWLNFGKILLNEIIE